MKQRLFDKLCAILLLFGTLPVFAEPADCSNAKTTLEINQCMAQKQAQARQVMQHYYDKAVDEYADDPVVRDSIRKAQTAWEKYAKAQCDSVYALWRDGSIRIIMTLDCQTRLIQQRTHQLWAEYLTHMDNSPAALPEPALPEANK